VLRFTCVYSVLPLQIGRNTARSDWLEPSEGDIGSSSRARHRWAPAHTLPFPLLPAGGFKGNPFPSYQDIAAAGTDGQVDGMGDAIGGGRGGNEDTWFGMFGDGDLAL
jgi:hypothetical protein